MRAFARGCRRCGGARRSNGFSSNDSGLRRARRSLRAENAGEQRSFATSHCDLLRVGEPYKGGWVAEIRPDRESGGLAVSPGVVVVRYQIERPRWSWPRPFQLMMKAIRKRTTMTTGHSDEQPLLRPATITVEERLGAAVGTAAFEASVRRLNAQLQNGAPQKKFAAAVAAV